MYHGRPYVRFYVAIAALFLSIRNQWKRCTISTNASNIGSGTSLLILSLLVAPPAPSPEQRMSDAAAPNDHTTTTTGMSGTKRTADEAAGGGGPDLDEVDEDGSVLTKAQKIERKRLRKKFIGKFTGTDTRIGGTIGWIKVGLEIGITNDTGVRNY